MLFRPLAAASLVLGAALAATATPPLTAAASFFQPGEVLEFRLGWGILTNSGTTRIETSEESFEGRPQYRVKVSTKSRGIVDLIYPIANNSESIIDYATGRPLSIKIEGKSGGRPDKTLTVFDYAKGEVVHTDFIRPSRSGTAAIPGEPAYDPLVAMLVTRSWHLQPGESRRVLCVDDQDFYTIEITGLAEEKVRTPVGTFVAVALEAKQVGELKGLFRKGGGLKVWISKGDKPQIVRIDTKVPQAGTITALLTKAEIVSAKTDAQGT